MWVTQNWIYKDSDEISVKLYKQQWILRLTIVGADKANRMCELSTFEQQTNHLTTNALVIVAFNTETILPEGAP